MKTHKSYYFLLLICLCLLYAENTSAQNALSKTNQHSKTNKSYKQKAKEAYDKIIAYYDIPFTNLFKENFPPQSNEPKTAYFWSHTCMLTAAVLLKSLGYDDSSLKKCFDGMEDYWDSIRLPATYQSAPATYGDSERFYDDAATAGLDLIEAYEVTKEKKYLDKAEACVIFDMSGESKDEGGGLFWCEQYRMNAVNDSRAIKATNATAFAATLALKLYQIDHKKEYLDFAERLYHWNKSVMQDPLDNLYWNDISLLTHQINKTKWTYNAGEMLSAACLLFTITKDTSYFYDAKELAKNSFDYFTKSFANKGLFFPNHDPWFTVILFRGYLDFYALDPNKTTKYINTFIDNADNAWLHARTSGGLFYEDWTGAAKGRYYWILNQAAMVEAYARIAIYKKSK